MIKCFEKEEEVRVRGNISQWGCCLTTLHKPTLTFKKLDRNGIIINLKITVFYKRNCHSRTLNVVSTKYRLSNRLKRLAKPILEVRFQQVPGFNGVKSMLMVQEEEDIKMNLVFPHHKAFCVMGATYFNTRLSTKS